MKKTADAKKNKNIEILSCDFEKSSEDEIREGEAEYERNLRLEDKMEEYSKSFPNIVRQHSGGVKTPAFRFILPFADRVLKGKVRYISKDKTYKIVYTNQSCLAHSVGKNARTINTKSPQFLKYFRKAKEIPSPKIKQDIKIGDTFESDPISDPSMRKSLNTSSLLDQNVLSLEKFAPDTTPTQQEDLKFSLTIEDFNQMVYTAVKNRNEKLLKELFGTPGECMKWRIQHNIHPK